MGRDERRRRGGGGRGAAGGPRDQQLRPLPRGRHPVRVAQGAGAAAAARHLRDRRARAAAAALAPRRQGALDLLVRRGARSQWIGRAGAHCQP